MQVPVLAILSYQYTVPVSFIAPDLRPAFQAIINYCQVEPYPFAVTPPCAGFTLQPVDRAGIMKTWNNKPALDDKINDALATGHWFFNQFYIQAPDSCNSQQLDQYFHQIPGVKKFMTDSGQNKDLNVDFLD